MSWTAFSQTPAFSGASVRGDVVAQADGPAMLAVNFTIEGSGTKNVLVRGAGPALATFGVPGTLKDPVVRLYNGQGSLIASNSRWGGTQALQNAALQAGAFAFSTNSEDAALIASLAPGTYTVVVASETTESGTALVEVYDLQTGSGRMVHFAARGRVSSGSGALVLGVVLPSGQAQVLVRGLGPALTASGVQGALSDPMLAVTSATSAALLGTNNNWDPTTGVAEAAATAGLAPLAVGSLDSALRVTFSQGGQSAQLSTPGAPGIGMIEVSLLDGRAAQQAPALIVPPSEISVRAGQSFILAAPVLGKPAVSYQWLRNGSPIAGATQAAYTHASAQASDTGTYAVRLTNSAGTTTATVASVMLADVLAIMTHPVSQTVTLGGTATFSVDAAGPGTLSYQWLFNGQPLAGATSRVLTVSNVGNSSVGAYSVRITNSMSTVTSNTAVLSLQGARPTIIEQPASQTVTSGGSVTFRVIATGGAGLTYQWMYNGAILGNAMDSTYTIPLVLASSAGNYSVRVSDSTGSVTSADALLTVRPASVAGGYFGSLGNGDGLFAFLLRENGSGTFLAYWRLTRQALISREVQVNAQRQLQFTAAALGGEGPASYQVSGRISEDGQFIGSIAGLTTNMVAGAPRSDGRADLVGLYEGGGAGTASRTFSLVGGAGDILTVVIEGSGVGAGRGLVGSDGSFQMTNEATGSIQGRIDGVVASVTVVPFGGGVTRNFRSANTDTRTDVEKLVNISTRSQTGVGDAALIAGFVVTGTQPKPMLVRVIGPTLASFGVGNPLAASHLEVYKGSTFVAQGDDWGRAANAAQLANMAAGLGAFALPAGSRDAALLLTLEPGAYTAIASGQGGATGVSLVEIYDASLDTVAKTERIVNIATRGVVGSGDQTLIAGFVIAGQVPKRLLVRGVGPTLGSSFGVGGVLAQPRVTVLSGSVEVATDARWSIRPDASEVAASAQSVGAFPLASGSSDAALIVNLAPGSYSAQVTNAGPAGATGIALVEVYELK